MKMKKLISGLLIFLAVFLSASASAVTMTFENIARNQDTPYSEFGFSAEAPGEHLHATPNGASVGVEMANDTVGSRFFKDDNGKFDFISLDILALTEAPANEADAFHFDGLANGAVAVSKQIAAGTTGLINFLSEDAKWSGLDSVQMWFGSAGQYGIESSLQSNFKFDNATLEATAVAPVPVPAAVWLFVSALSGLGLVRKKQAA